MQTQTNQGEFTYAPMQPMQQKPIMPPYNPETGPPQTFQQQYIPISTPSPVQLQYNTRQQTQTTTTTTTTTAPTPWTTTLEKIGVATFSTPFLTILNLIAVLVHVSGFIAVLALGVPNDVIYTTTKTVPVLEETNDPNKQRFMEFAIDFQTQDDDVKLSLAALLAGFFALSAFFQLFFKSIFSRYIEYTFSACLPAVVITLQALQYDTHVLLAIVGLHVTCMLCGAVADVIYTNEQREAQDPNQAKTYNQLNRYITIENQPIIYKQHPAPMPTMSAVSSTFPMAPQWTPTPSENMQSKTYTGEWTTNLAWWNRPHWLVHLLGWVPYITAWVIILRSYSISITQNPETPSWVSWIVVGEFLFFTAFGIVQIAHFTGVSENKIHMAYIILSLAAKTTLASVMASQLFIE